MTKLDEAIKVLMSYWGIFKTDVGYEYINRPGDEIRQILGIIALLKAAEKLGDITSPLEARPKEARNERKRCR